MSEAVGELGVALHCPRPVLTTDNAAMIAAAGMFRLLRGERSDYTLDADPTLKLAPAPPPSRQGRWKQ
jgi:N6-L-threonylcarbamoyladenine synthase